MEKTAGYVQTRVVSIGGGGYQDTNLPIDTDVDSGFSSGANWEARIRSGVCYFFKLNSLRNGGRGALTRRNSTWTTWSLPFSLARHALEPLRYLSTWLLPQGFEIEEGSDFAVRADLFLSAVSILSGKNEIGEDGVGKWINIFGKSQFWDVNHRIWTLTNLTFILFRGLIKFDLSVGCSTMVRILMRNITSRDLWRQPQLQKASFRNARTGVLHDCFAAVKFGASLPYFASTHTFADFSNVNSWWDFVRKWIFWPSVLKRAEIREWRNYSVW